MLVTFLAGLVCSVPLIYTGGWFLMGIVFGSYRYLLLLLMFWLVICNVSISLQLLPFSVPDFWRGGAEG